nr:glycosyltransferase [Piscirickettsia litoralis]
MSLVVVGDKEKSFRGAGFSTAPEKTLLLGRVHDEDLAVLYAGARGFVFPSLYEGFGIPAIESMAASTPVITSNTTSLPEIVGDSAILIDPYNIDDIAKAIDSLAFSDELCRELSEKGDQRVLNFSWDKCADDTYKFLSSAL